MTNAGFFRGTSAEQDFRFSNKQNKGRKEFKYPPIDTSKIDVESLKPWISDRIKNILDNHDELMSDAILEFFSEKEVDGSALSQFISGFADVDKTSKFIQEVWSKFDEIKEEACSNKIQTVACDEIETNTTDAETNMHDKTKQSSMASQDNLALLAPFLKKVEVRTDVQPSEDSIQEDDMSFSDDDRPDSDVEKTVNDESKKIDKHERDHRGHRTDHHRDRDRHERRHRSHHKRDRHESSHRSRDRSRESHRRSKERDDDPKSRHKHKHKHRHKESRRHKHKHSRD